MFLSELTNNTSKTQNTKNGFPKKQYRVLGADGKPVVLELFLNPGRVFDRAEIENPTFQAHLVRESDFRNKGNRRFLERAELVKERWMSGKFEVPYESPLTIKNVGRIFIPPTDDSQEVELARV